MSRLDELIVELCPDGVEYKKLGDVATITRGGSFQKKDYVASGYPCIHYGQIYTLYGLFVNETAKFISEETAAKQKKASKNDVIMAVTSENVEDVCKCVAWLGEGEVAVSGHTAIIHHTLNPKYLVYWLHSSMFYSQKIKLAHGTKVIEVSPNSLESVVLPVPPLPVQQEIVRILDHFTELTAELQEQLIKEEQLLSLKQKYYLNKLVSSNIQYETRQLRDLMNVRMCKRIQKNQTVSNGSIPFYKNGTLGKEADTYIPVELYEEYKAKYPYPEKGAVMLSTAGTVGRAWIFDGKPAYFQDSNVVWLENDENFVSNEYLYWFCLSMPWKLPSRGTIKHLHNDMILDTYISVPPLHIQNDCINFLKAAINNFELMRESLLSEISNRQKQYEYYRDKILTFPEKG